MSLPVKPPSRHVNAATQVLYVGSGLLVMLTIGAAWSLSESALLALVDAYVYLVGGAFAAVGVSSTRHTGEGYASKRASPPPE